MRACVHVGVHRLELIPLFACAADAAACPSASSVFLPCFFCVVLPSFGWLRSNPPDATLPLPLPDYAVSNITVLRQHPCLQPLVQLGVLDFAVFDANSGAAVRGFLWRPRVCIVCIYCVCWVGAFSVYCECWVGALSVYCECWVGA